MQTAPKKTENIGTILVIGDSEADLCRQLGNCIHETFTVKNAGEAVDALDKRAIDLIIIDTTVGSSGDNMTAFTIKESSKFRHIPVLAVLPPGDDDLIEDALEAGIDDYINPPFSPSDLSNRINWLVRQSSIFRSETVKLEGEAELQASFKKIKTALLQTSFYDLSVLGNPLEETLKLALSIILSAPLLPEVPAGVIFLSDRDEEHLRIACQLGLSDDLSVKCAVLKKGQCLCGAVLASKKILFSDHVDGQHSISYPDMPNHGHYVVPIMREKGRVLGVLNVYMDSGTAKSSELELFLADIALILGMIISRKYYESRLIASESRFSSISNSSYDGIITVNQDGRITFANGAAHKLFRYDEGGLLGQQLTVIIPERYKKLHLAGIQRAIESRKTALEGQTVELTGLRRDHFEVSIEISLSMWESNGNLSFAAFIRDITQRKEMDRALLQAKLDVEKSNEELARVNEILLEERNKIENIVLKIHQSPLFDPTDLRILEQPLEKNSGDLICAARRSDGSHRVLLGDFAGHGLTAAIAGPLISEIFYNFGLESPFEKMFRTLNLRLLQALNEDMYMACSCLELNTEKNRLSLFNAGMVDICIFRNGAIIHKEPSAFVPRGLMDVPDKEKTVLDVQPGDRVVMCTDGFEETLDPQGKMLGEERFHNILQATIAKNRPLATIIDDIDRFRNGGRQEDDMTLVELTC